MAFPTLWYATMYEHFGQNLGMQRERLDHDMYVLHTGASRNGLTSTYVGDLLYKDNSYMRKSSNHTRMKFEMYDDEQLSIALSEIYIRRSANATLTIDEKGFVRKHPLSIL